MTRSTAFVLAGLLWGAAPALADPKQDAKAHFAAGQEAYQRDDYAKAIEEFSAAYALDPAPVYLYNTAVAYELWGKKEKSVEFYLQYLPHAEAKERPAIEAKITSLGGTLPEKPATPPVEKKPTEESTSKESATLRVSSEPAGASVWIGEKAGAPAGKTPLSLTLAPGKHEVWLELEGYAPAKRTLEIPVGQAMTALDLSLARQETSALVSIQANVAGAQVYVDDKAKGVAGLTPFQLQLAPGEHTLIVEKEGYQPLTQTLTLKPGDGPQTVSLLIERSPFGRLKVSTNQRGAVVYVDGKRVGAAPFEGPLPQLTEGDHTVRVEARGFSPWEGEIDVDGGALIHIKTDLAREPRKTGAIIALAMAGGFAAGGIVLGGQAQALFNDLDADINNGLPVDDNDPRFRDGLFRSIGADVAFGLAGVTTLVAASRFFAKGKPSKGEVVVRPVEGPRWAWASAPVPAVDAAPQRDPVPSLRAPSLSWEQARLAAQGGAR